MAKLPQIADAMREAEGKTPGLVLDALAPLPVSVLGVKLLPVSASQWLVFERLRHPFVGGDQGEEHGTEVLASALVVMSRPGRESLHLIATGQFDGVMADMLEVIPPHEIERAGEEIAGHFFRSTSTALSMQSAIKGSKKKPGDSDGS